MFTYWLIFGIVCFIVILATAISIIIFNKKSKEGGWLVTTFIIGVFVLFISLTLLNIIFNNSLKSELESDINSNYDLNISLDGYRSNKEAQFSYNNYYAGKLLGPFVGEYTDDSRLYDIYIRYNDGLTLYIKNEKGAYIPITDMSTDFMKKH